MMLGAVALVLLIAAINVANLQLARGAARRPELATRLALGASRWRLLRQLATEGAVIALAGGTAGVLLAVFLIPRLASVVFGARAAALDLSVDLRVLLMACAATMTTALVVGVIPAVRLSAPQSSQSLAPGDRSRESPGSQRLMRTLLVAQFALSLMLVTAAGLLLQTSVRLSGIELGFDRGHVVLLEIADETPGSSTSFNAVETPETRARRAAAYRLVDERLNALPGVQSSSLAWYGLFSTNDLWTTLIDPRRTSDRREARVNFVSPRYFDTVGMRVASGRGFTDADGFEAPRVAVVNQTLARERFGDRDPIGAQLTPDFPGDEDQPLTIVGVLEDARYNSLRETTTGPMIWLPLQQAVTRINSAELRVQPGAEAAVSQTCGGGSAIRESVPDGPAKHDPCRSGVRHHSSRASPLHGVHGIWRLCLAARRDWPARDAGLQGCAPQARDRRTAGTRRTTVIGRRDVLQGRARIGRGIRRHRRAHCTDDGLGAPRVSLWRRAARSADRRRRLRRPGRDRADGVVRARLPGESCRSSDRTAERMMRTFLRGCWDCFGGMRWTLRLDEEVRTHLDALAADYERRGLTPKEARLAARRDFGGVEPMKELHRDRRMLRAVDDVWRDVRYAVRTLGRRPVFAGVAVLTLGLGIGANTAVFSLINDYLFRTLPVRDAETLVTFRWTGVNDVSSLRASYGYIAGADSGRNGGTSFPYATFVAFRDANHTLDDLAAFAPSGRGLNAIVQGNAEFATGQYVSGNFYPALGNLCARGPDDSSVGR